jgi:hypothetical protein
MSMLAYFETMAVMLAFYCLARWLIWAELQPPAVKEPRRPWSAEPPGKAIDGSPLCDRLQHVRQDYLMERPAGPQSFKQPLLVESKRAEVAKQAFFQKPPPEPEEPEDGFTMVFV